MKIGEILLPSASNRNSAEDECNKQQENLNLTTKETLSSIWTGAKNKAKNMFCENGEISLKKIGETALWAVLFTAGTRAGVAKGYIRAKTVSQTLIGLGAGIGGYEIYNGIGDSNKAKSRKEKMAAFEKISGGTAAAAFSLLPAKFLSKGLNNIQGSANITSKASLSEVVKASLDNKALIQSMKDKNSLPLLWYGMAAGNTDF